MKHILLTGKQTSISKGIHSFQDLLERGARLSHEKLKERQASVNPDSPAVIFYTSGTTGQPKGATLTNFGLVNMSQGITEHLGQYFTRLCAPIPMFHIFSEVVGVMSPVTAKCQIVFPAILPSPVATMRAIEEEKCTTMIGAPIIYRDILDHPDRKKYDLSSLEYGAIGASPVHVDVLRQIENDFPLKRIAQVYGMTENTAILTSSMWTGDENQTRRHASIGRCMQRLEIKVVDPQGNPVPIGQQGEIWARGFPIMAGYYGEPQKTSEAVTSSGWLRTGDQGKMDEDGYLYYIGRQKEMIIRGGVNIYPIEIENTIAEHPSVAEAQVFSIPDTRHDEEICAWIKLKPDAPKCQPEDIAKHLANRIAFFKIPKHIRIVDKFIMTPTGKIQKFKMSEVMSKEVNPKTGQT